MQNTKLEKKYEVSEVEVGSFDCISDTYEELDSSRVIAEAPNGSKVIEAVHPTKGTILMMVDCDGFVFLLCDSKQ